MAMHRLCTGYAQAMHRRHTTLLLPERLPTTLLLPEGCPMGGTFIFWLCTGYAQIINKLC